MKKRLESFLYWLLLTMWHCYISDSPFLARVAAVEMDASNDQFSTACVALCIRRLQIRLFIRLPEDPPYVFLREFLG